MYLKIGENQKAFEKLLDVTHLDDQHTNALMALGAILQSKHDIDGALNKYKRIPQIHMEGGELWSNIAMCFFRKRKYVAVSKIKFCFECKSVNERVNLFGIIFCR